MKRLVMPLVAVTLSLAACSSPSKPVVPVYSPDSVVPSSSPTPNTITADGYYVTLPLPIPSTDHPETVDLSTYDILKVGTWNLPRGCAVTLFDTAGYATAQSTNAVKIVVGPVSLKLPQSSLIYTHGCSGMALQGNN